MTTNVPKGAGRAAHAARTAKHAQRTPLPEKGAKSGVSKKVSADPIREEVGKSKMLAAKSRGRKVASKAAPSTRTAAPEPKGTGSRTPAKRTATPSPLAGKGTAAERGAVSAALKKAGKPKKAAPVASPVSEPTPAPRTPARPRKAPTATVGPKKGASKPVAEPESAPEPTGSKAEALAAWAETVGWTATLEVHGTEEMVMCEREPERVIVNFSDNKLNLGLMPTHEYGSRVVKLRNVSAAKKVMETSPEDAAAAVPAAGPRRERTARGRLETAEGDEGAAVLRRRVPWAEGEEPDDETLIKAVIGKRIVWMNRVAGTYEEATVMPKEKQKQLKVIVAPNGKRVLQWASVEGGFRSVYIEMIWQVK